MKREAQPGRKKAKLLATLALAATFVWSAPAPVRALPATAQRFVNYLGSLEGAGQEKLSLWDRVTYSLVLAGGNPKRQSS